MASNLTLRRPLPSIPGAGSLDIRVTYPGNAPTGMAVALLRLPNDYYVIVLHSSPVKRWAVIAGHYVVPGTGVVDPRPLDVDPRGTGEVRWKWEDGRSIASALRDLAPLPPYRHE